MSADPRFFMLSWIARILCPDYPMKWPQLDWIHDADFRAYLARFDETGPFKTFNAERRWMMRQMLRLAQGAEGDTAECGVFQGAGSYQILRVNTGRRQHHIFDSFEGISAPETEDGNYWTAGAFATREQVVDRNLKEFSGQYRLYKGWIPDRFPEVADRKFAFVHIDVDLHQPTLDSIAFFYPRLSPGGVLVCDDYGSATCPGASRAIDEFLADKPEKMIEMTCGSGFMIKGLQTEPAPSATPRGLSEAHPSVGAIVWHFLTACVALPLYAARYARMQLARRRPKLPGSPSP
jgi:O-methyltransferase